MTIEQQVCSLELAKRLKELGVKQESLFYWSSATSKNPSDYKLIYHTDYQSNDNPYDDYLRSLLENESDEIVSAFTASELGEILKENVNEIKYGFCHGITDWYFYKEKEDDYEYSNTEADARAKMLIYLLENKLITL